MVAVGLWGICSFWFNSSGVPLSRTGERARVCARSMLRGPGSGASTTGRAFARWENPVLSAGADPQRLLPGLLDHFATSSFPLNGPTACRITCLLLDTHATSGPPVFIK